jgi:hypothetical protein
MFWRKYYPPEVTHLRSPIAETGRAGPTNDDFSFPGKSESSVWL